MPQPAISLELRKHPRACLRLPVRIRWLGPLGMRLETTKTIDASREGLLVRRVETCASWTRVWVTFPFDSAGTDPVQPETPARIVRVENGGQTAEFRVALHLELPPRNPPRPANQERRASARVPFALPMFVRPAGSPWAEESMVEGLSHNGARFETSHIYATGDEILAKVSWSEWAGAEEIPGRVVRVQAVKDRPGPAPLAHPAAGVSAILTSVAVRWTRPATKGRG